MHILQGINELFYGKVKTKEKLKMQRVISICFVKEKEKGIENKDNNENENENENDSQTNIDIVDFDINEERTNIVSDSKRNSIFINGLLEHNDLLYSSINIDELIQNCNLPKFNETDFIFENSIGEGSFGTIFEVEEIKTGNKYAIKKIICQDIQELIKQKAQLELIYSIEHENIMKIYKVQIKSLDMTTYSISILMELASSDWNKEIIKRADNNEFYKENELIEITKQIVNGLLYLKKKNISHRDIKPQNILIFPNNVFKVADFGEAKNIIDGTKLRTLKGCELYMSPALYWGYIHGKKNLVHNAFKSDVFSLGYCLLFAMTLNIHTLEKIRKLNNNNEIIDVIMSSLNNNNYSSKFLDIIFKMIDIDEQQRYDFDNLKKDIDNYI
jgi:serine/threonine protein kinase